MHSPAQATLLPGVDLPRPGERFETAVHRLLAVVRTQLDMRVAWVSEFVGAHQVLRFVDAEPGAPSPQEGATLPLSGSFCARVVDGRFPSLIPDTRRQPEAAMLDVTDLLSIGAYIGVPLLGAQGTVTGMLCAISDSPCPSLTERDVTVMRLLAEVLHDLQRRAVDEVLLAAERSEREERMAAVIAGQGRHAVLQPIVDLTTGRCVAAEGLTRFDGGRPPAQWFDDASRLGLRTPLELATASAVLDLLDDGRVPPDVVVSVNLAPDTLLDPGLPALLDGRPLERVCVEVTEHAPVSDYAQLREALRPWRAQGLRLAVDDAGAGYASLTHVLAVRPDVVKVDMALTHGVDADPVRRTLFTALAGFAEDTGCLLAAEGVETPGELDALVGCGVHWAQGYLIGRPAPAPSFDGLRG